MDLAGGLRRTDTKLSETIASITKDSKDRQATTLLWGLPLMILLRRFLFDLMKTIDTLGRTAMIRNAFTSLGPFGL